MAFPVYRTYVQSDSKEVAPEDRCQILIAIRDAKRHNPAMNWSVFDFLRSVLLLEHPDGVMTLSAPSGRCSSCASSN